MRAAWVALIAGVALGVAVVAAVPAPAGGLGPVARALALDHGPDLDARRAAAVAEAARHCLARDGISARPLPEPTPVIPDAELDPIAWAERWGFGITTASGWHGGTVVDLPVASDSAGPERAACQEEAALAVYGLRDRLLAPLRPALAALGASIDADPATVAADAAWTACVDPASAALDPPVAPPTEPGRLEAIRGWFAARAGPRPDPSIVALERRVAAAIARCDLAFVELRRRAADPHERAFVREHGPALRRIGAAIRAAEAAYPGP
jgi:hypothetical protein